MSDPPGRLWCDLRLYQRVCPSPPDVSVFTPFTPIWASAAPLTCTNTPERPPPGYPQWVVLTCTDPPDQHRREGPHGPAAGTVHPPARPPPAPGADAPLAPARAWRRRPGPSSAYPTRRVPIRWIGTRRVAYPLGALGLGGRGAGAGGGRGSGAAPDAREAATPTGVTASVALGGATPCGCGTGAARAPGPR